MSRGLLDTSIFIAQEVSRPLEVGRIPDTVAVSVVTISELQFGVLSAPGINERQRRLSTYREALRFDPIPIDLGVADAFAELRSRLGAKRKNISVNDLWIAATAKHLEIPLVTQDRELSKIPGVEVILV